MPYIVFEPKGKEEEQMAPRLTANFKERHRKCLSEALPIALLPAKKSRLEALHEEPVLDTPTVHMPLTDAIGSGRELAVIPSIEDACPVEDETSDGTLSGHANKRDAPDNPSS